MDVTVLTATPNPAMTISMAAGLCYGKNNHSETRLATCMNSGHFSVFEHAGATWKVEGISRACSHQLVRHRVASYSQQSQRYCKIDVGNDDWYVMPPWMDDAEFEEARFEYRKQMGFAAQTYLDLLDHGANPEDARYVLPNACKTNICVTMNFRELMHFLDLRLDKRAQWEIRELAKKMAYSLAKVTPEWSMLLNMYKGHSSEISSDEMKYFTWRRP